MIERNVRTHVRTEVRPIVTARFKTHAVFDLRAHVRSQKYMPKDVSKHISDLTAEQVSKHAKKMSEHIPEHFPAIPELMQEQMSGVHMSGSVSVCCDSLSIPLPCLLPNRP